MTIVLAILGGLAIGGSLGLLGGGGAILAVPLLLALGAPPKSAIAISLVVVASTALVAAAGHARAKRIDWATALPFAPATMLGGWAGGRAAGVVPGERLILAFALLMLAAAAAMWRARPAPPARPPHRSAARIAGSALAGTLVGALTGLVGAGGGFLFVPIFTLLLGLPAHRAVGTSLLVIALNASAALAGQLSHVSIDRGLAIPVAGGALAGALAGTRLSAGASERALRRGFALLMVAIALWLIARGA